MRIDINEAVEFLKTHDNYLILMHANPDGDTLGSGSALCGALQALGKNARVQCPDYIPERFAYLEQAYRRQDFEPDTIIAVDVADSKLLGDLKPLGDKAELCIDHHESNINYAARTLVKPDYAAAAELIYEVILALGVSITAEMASALYTGISTDCGCFKFSNTTPQTHRYAAELMELGADYARINYVMFELKTQGRMKLEQEVLRGIKYYADGHVALISVPKSLVDSIVDIDSDDVGAMAAIPRQIEGVDIGISIKQKGENLYKASLRTSLNIDAGKIAAQFGGGGHARAAGCSFENSTYEQAEKLISDACIEACRKAGLI